MRWFVQKNFCDRLADRKNLYELLAGSNSDLAVALRAGLFIPAGLLGGMGVGFLVGNIPAGMFIGLGLGFAAFAIVSLTVKK